MHTSILFFAVLLQCGPGGCPPSGYGIGLGGYSPYGNSGIGLGIGGYSQCNCPACRAKAGRDRQGQGQSYGPGNCKPGCPGNCGCGCGDHDQSSDYDDMPPYDMPPYNRGDSTPKTSDTFAKNPQPKPKFTATTPNKIDGFAKSTDGVKYLYFVTAKWCKPCAYFYKDFADNTEAGKQLREDYIIVVVDYDRKGELIKKLEKHSGEKIDLLPFFYCPEGRGFVKGYKSDERDKLLENFLPPIVPLVRSPSPIVPPPQKEPTVQTPVEIDYDKLATLAASRIVVDYTEINKYIDNRTSVATIDYDKLVSMVIEKMPKPKYEAIDYNKIKFPEIKQETIDYDKLASLVADKLPKPVDGKSPTIDLDALSLKVLEKLPKEQIFYDLKQLPKSARVKD